MLETKTEAWPHSNKSYGMSNNNNFNQKKFKLIKRVKRIAKVRAKVSFEKVSK